MNININKIIKHTLLLLLFLASSPVALFAQQQKGYEIIGRVNGLKEGEKVIMNMMVYNPGSADEVTRDSGYVKNGEFRITGFVPDGPRFYWMRFPNHLPFSEYVLRMVIDNGERITVSYNQDISKVRDQLLEHYLTVEGSPSNYGWHLMLSADDMFSQTEGRINRELRKAKDSVGFDKSLVTGLMLAKRNLRETLKASFLNELMPDFKPAALMFSFYEDGDHDSVWSTVYNQLDDHLRNSVYGKKLQLRLPLLLGLTAPVFALPSQEGSNLGLTEVVNKSKVTIVHFWATNSVKRKAFDGELRVMYKKYHDKGLNILAVSTDSYKEQWEGTLQAEKYPWANVLDIKGKQVADPLYHELGQVDHQNTTNVLLDYQGKIIAWDVSGLQLQWYLDKYLGGDSK